MAVAVGCHVKEQDATPGSASCPPHLLHSDSTRRPPRSATVGLSNHEGVIELSKTTRWILGLTILALLAAGTIALAGAGFGGRSAGVQATCPAATDGALCDVDTDGDGIVNADDPDWVCPQDGSECGQVVGTCLGLSTTRPLDGSGAQCAGTLGQRVGACRGGRF